MGCRGGWDLRPSVLPDSMSGSGKLQASQLECEMGYSGLLGREP